MQVSIDYQPVELSEEEHQYYQELIKQLTTDNKDGKDYFRNLFSTDDRGFITLIKPQSAVPWAAIFFIQQVMISQRLRIIDEFMYKQEKK